MLWIVRAAALGTTLYFAMEFDNASVPIVIAYFCGMANQWAIAQQEWQ